MGTMDLSGSLGILSVFPSLGSLNIQNMETHQWPRFIGTKSTYVDMQILDNVGLRKYISDQGGHWQVHKKDYLSLLGSLVTPPQQDPAHVLFTLILFVNWWETELEP